MSAAGAARAGGPRRRAGVGVELLLGALVCGIPAWVLATFFSPAPAPLLLAAVVTGCLVAVPSSARRLPVEVGVVLGGALLAYLVTWVLFPSSLLGGVPDLPALRDCGLALAQGWSRLLSVGVPAAPEAPLLVLPASLAALAGFTTTFLLRRTRVSLAAGAPGLALLLVGLMLVSVRDTDQLAPTAAFLAAVLLLVFVRVGARGPRVADDPARGPAASTAAGPTSGTPAVADPSADRSSGRGRRRAPGRVALGVPVLAAVCAAAVVAGSALPVGAARDRFDPRTLRTPPAELQDHPSPLLGLRSQLDTRPPAELFTVRLGLERGAGVDRPLIRVAALSSFDGVTWRNDGLFSRPGARLPSEGDLARPVRARMDVTVTGLAGPWLPVLGRPVRTTAQDVVYSASTGTLLTRRAQVRGLRYTVDAELRARDDRALASALPDTSGSAVAALALPAGMPEGLRDLALDVTSGATSPYAKLRALEAYLRRQPYALKNVAPGHSYAVLSGVFLTEDGTATPSFAEQHAAAFAVMARSLRFPARVAVGYTLNGPRSADGARTVTSAQAHAWPEVHLRGQGWVPFEPTDVREVPASTPRSQEEPRPESSSGGVPPQEGEIFADLDLPGAQAASPSLGQRARQGGVLGLGMLVLALVLTRLAKAVRRHRRRRRGGASRRVAGAWRECVDRLVEAGLRPVASMTPLDVAVQLEARVGNGVAAPVYEIAPVLGRALYAPVEPSASDVVTAWRCERALRRALDARVALPRRLWHRVDPRPLVTRRLTTRGGRWMVPEGEPVVPMRPGASALPEVAGDVDATLCPR